MSKTAKLRGPKPAAKPGKPAAKPALPPSGVATAKRPAKATAKPSSKQEGLITLLRRPSGATISQLIKATGWQAHSVRGVMSGVLKKKLGLAIKSEKPIDGERTYRIA